MYFLVCAVDDSSFANVKALTSPNRGIEVDPTESSDEDDKRSADVSDHREEGEDYTESPSKSVTFSVDDDNLYFKIRKAVLSDHDFSIEDGDFVVKNKQRDDEDVEKMYEKLNINQTVDEIWAAVTDNFEDIKETLFPGPKVDGQEKKKSYSEYISLFVDENDKPLPPGHYELIVVHVIVEQYLRLKLPICCQATETCTVVANWVDLKGNYESAFKDEYYAENAVLFEQWKSEIGNIVDGDITELGGMSETEILNPICRAFSEDEKQDLSMYDPANVKFWESLSYVDLRGFFLQEFFKTKGERDFFRVPSYLPNDIRLNITKIYELVYDFVNSDKTVSNDIRTVVNSEQFPDEKWYINVALIIAEKLFKDVTDTNDDDKKKIQSWRTLLEENMPEYDTRSILPSPTSSPRSLSPPASLSSSSSSSSSPPGSPTPSRSPRATPLRWLRYGPSRTRLSTPGGLCY